MEEIVDLKNSYGCPIASYLTYIRKVTPSMAERVRMKTISRRNEGNFVLLYDTCTLHIYILRMEKDKTFRNS